MYFAFYRYKHDVHSLVVIVVCIFSLILFISVFVTLDVLRCW